MTLKSLFVNPFAHVSPDTRKILCQILPKLYIDEAGESRFRTMTLLSGNLEHVRSTNCTHCSKTSYWYFCRLEKPNQRCLDAKCIQSFQQRLTRTFQWISGSIGWWWTSETAQLWACARFYPDDTRRLVGMRTHKLNNKQLLIILCFMFRIRRTINYCWCARWAENCSCKVCA